MESPRFTLLICVRDRAERLCECLRSLQPLVSEASAQLLIVCDGGDATVRVAAAPLFPSGPWQTDWLDVPAGGPARARNAAMSRVRGEIILFLNDDVRCEPGLLRAHDRLHCLRPGHAVMGNTRWAPEVVDSEFMHWVAHHDSFYYLVPDQLSATWEYFHTMNLSIHRRWFDEGYRFDEGFPDPAFEDTELGYRLWGKGLKIGFSADAVLYHVHHFTPEQYVSKARERGRSARRFCELYPELRDRILGEFEQCLARGAGLRNRLRRLVDPPDALERWEEELARAFLAGYREGASIAPTR